MENRPTRGWRALELGELWARRELVALLARRDLKARYKQAALGAAWTVGQPLVGMAVLVLVFRRVAGVSSEGVPYTVFALAGFALWSYMAGTVQAVAASMLAHGPLLTKVYIPRLAVPVAACLPGLLHLAVATCVLGVAMAVTGVGLSARAAAVPLCVALATAVGLGTGLWLAALNVIYRDVGHAVGYLLQLWFLVTPVAYPPSAVRGSARLLLALNPAAGAVESFRAAMLGTPFDPRLVAASAAVALAVLAGGLAVFVRLERRLVDEL